MAGISRTKVPNQERRTAEKSEYDNLLKQCRSKFSYLLVANHNFWLGMEFYAPISDLDSGYTTAIARCFS